MAKKTYTLAEVEAMDREFLTPEIVAGVIGWDPYSINVQVKEDPSRLGFPVSMCGTRVRIPKEGFLRFCRGDRETVIRRELTLVKPPKKKARKKKAPKPVEAAG